MVGYCFTISVSFAKEICDLDFIFNDFIVATLDVGSLYANVPLVEPVNFSIGNVFSLNPDHVDGLTVELFRPKTQELALRSSFVYLFDNKL